METATACDSYTWPLSGETYADSGTYNFETVNAAGCTHTTTLELTINVGTASTDSVTACGSYVWAVNDTTYTQSGTYTSTIGCDTYELVLTIVPTVTIVTQPSATAMCGAVGSTTNLTVAVLETDTVTYQWEYSEDNGTSWALIDADTASDIYTNYDTSVLTITVTTTAPLHHTQYRALLDNGVCDVLPSNAAVLGVYSLLNTAVSGAVKVCAGGSNTLTLAAGSIGDIQWKYWNPTTSLWIATGTTTYASSLGAINPANSITINNISQNVWYKAVLSNSVCQAIQTNLVNVTVSQPAVGGTITGGNISVCPGDNSTVLTLTNSAGTRVWQKSTNYDSNNPGAATWVNAGGAGLTFTAFNIGVTTWYRVVLSSNLCPTTYSTITVIQMGNSLAKKPISGETSVCSGTNSSIITLNAGSVGNVQWQSSTDNGTSWINEGNLITATTSFNDAIIYTAVNLTVTTLYRVVFSNGLCTPISTTPVTITVNPSVESGSLSGGNVSYCNSTNSTTLTLTNNNNTQIQWQKSSSASGPFTAITGITTTAYTIINLNTTTWYRVLVGTGSCALASDPVSITIVSGLIAGTITGPSSVCSGSSATLSLTGSLGDTIQWQSALNATGTFTNIDGATQSNYIITNAFAAMDKSYRVIVTNTCNNTTVTTAIKTIKVDPISVSGTITGGGVVALGGSGTLKVIGYVGKIQWEYSNDGNNFSNAPKASDIFSGIPFSTTSVTSTGASYLVTNIQGNVYFRARITSGTCNPVYTTTVYYIIMNNATVGNITPTSATICSGTGTTLELSEATGTITWEKSTNYTAITPTWVATTNHTTVMNTPNLTVSTAYRVKVVLGNSIVYSSLAYVNVIVKPIVKTIAKNSTTPSGSSALAAMCTSDASKVLTLGAGYSGSIQWQTSIISSTTDFTDINGASASSSYTIANPVPGANYFRVKLTNSCGVVAYTNAVSVYYKTCALLKETIATPFSAVVYPNPYNDNFQLKITSSSTIPLTIVIYDMTGRLIEKEQVTVQEINDQILGTQLPSGIYTVLISQDSVTQTLRVVKR
jgi:hypothetical protein